jgi:transcriptional regulator with XRE-family HTH domain
VTDGSFCARLRRERERRQIALSSISANTKIRVGLFEALERGDVSRWPAGIYRKATIRAYATGVGLDPDEIAREFSEHFPDPDDTPPAQLAAAPRAIRASRETVLRLTLADDGSPFKAGRLLQRMHDRLAAVAFDAGVVLAIGTSVFVVCGAFWMPLAVSTLAYYLGGILLLGNTPGVCLRASGPRGPTRSFLITLRSTIAKTAVGWFAHFKREAPAPGSLRAIR